MSAQKRIATISEFLLHAGTNHFIIDLGRGRTMMDNQQFFEIENAMQPYPTPRQGFAWICVVFWNAEKNADLNSVERYMWFLKLPLDERGLIQPAARDQFLQIVVESLGNSLEKQTEDNAQLPENPFVFVPSQQQLADTNAMIKHHLGLELSEGHGTALAYLQAPLVLSWESLSVQSISDNVVGATDSTTVKNALMQNFSKFAPQVQNCVLSTLEGEQLDDELSEFLLSQLEQVSGEMKPFVVRALSKATASVKLKMLEKLLTSELDMEMLVVIAGRHWALLTDNNSLGAYLTKVVQVDSSLQLFQGIYADLVRVPETRIAMLTLLRDGSESTELQKAITSLAQLR